MFVVFVVAIVVVVGFVISVAELFKSNTEGCMILSTSDSIEYLINSNNILQFTCHHCQF